MRDVVSWVTQMRLSAPPRPQLFLPVRQISHVWLLKTPSPPFLVHQSHILRCICVSREKMPIFATTYHWLVLQVPTRRAAVTSTVSSATTTARTRTRWGCTREPRIFISLQCNMCNGQCKQEKVSEEVPGRAGYWKLKEDFYNWTLCRWWRTGGSTKSWTASWLQVSLSYINSIIFLCGEFCSVYLFTN